MAGITHLKQFQKPALRGLVDETVNNAPITFADIYMPTEETFDRQFAYNIVKTNNFMAGYIGMGSEPPVVDRNAVASRMGEIAQFGLQDIVTYEELVAINEARNDREEAAMIDKVVVRNIDIVNGTLRLIQLAKLEAMLKGTLSYSGNNVKINFDFGIPAENKVGLSAGNDFNNADFDIIGFLLAQVQAYSDANSGKIPDEMLVSRELNAKILTNAKIIAEVGRPAGSTRVNQEELSELLNSYELPPLRVVSERKMTYKDNATGKDVVREFMPVNRIVMISQGVGTYLLGPTLENDFQPGIYLNNEDLTRPVRSVIETYGAGFPTMENPYLIRHLDVYTP
ncbi:major capsid protein [Priestia megaterium]|uniref:major capsid protein n=1 Tax=Priestia megaterium TaxID=1404 RepID=UPI001364108A|nr:major capsid protein [Priestia megaterium]